MLSRITRTHLLYQFIILTSISLWIAHDEFMLDKKLVFLLGFVPVFIYQFVTISWCYELLPETQRSCINEVMFGKDESGLCSQVNEKIEENSGSQVPKEESNRIKNQENTAVSPTTDTKPRIYTFRGFHKSPQIPTVPFNANGAEKLPRITWGSEKNPQQDSEVTKRYFFPYRQKRPENWIDPNGLKRPFKIRPRVSNIDEGDEEDIRPTAEETSIPDSSSKIKKSYTFPRQKRREIQERPVEADVSCEGMPLLPNKEYLTEARNRTRRRRSASISHLNAEQEEMNRRKEHEFSQSVEISNPSRAENRTPTVGKAKSGFLNYFSKIKKENNSWKTSCKKINMQNGIMKSLFQSRENLKASESDDKKPMTETKEGFTYYPGYSLFDSSPFEIKERSEKK